MKPCDEWTQAMAYRASAERRRKTNQRWDRIGAAVLIALALAVYVVVFSGAGR